MPNPESPSDLLDQLPPNPLSFLVLLALRDFVRIGEEWEGERSSYRRGDPGSLVLQNSKRFLLRVIISVFVSHVVSVSAAQLCHCSTKAAIDNL